MAFDLEAWLKESEERLDKSSTTKEAGFDLDAWLLESEGRLGGDAPLSHETPPVSDSVELSNTPYQPEEEALISPPSDSGMKPSLFELEGKDGAFSPVGEEPVAEQPRNRVARYEWQGG